MADPPVYELVDSSGNVVGEFNQEVANNLLRISNEQTNTEIQVKNGEVDYQNNDISNVGALSTEEASIAQLAARISSDTDQTIPTGTVTEVSFDSISFEDTDVVSVNLSNNQISADVAGKFYVKSQIRYDGSANWSNGDRVFMRYGNQSAQVQIHHSGADEFITVSVDSIIDASQGETIFDAETLQNSGSDQTLRAGNSNTFAVVGRLG